MKKKKNITTLIIVLIIIIIAIIGCLFVAKSIDSSITYIVEKGNLSKEDEEIGYIIRDEKILKGEDYKNGLYTIASEGKRVAVGEPIFRYYGNDEKETKAKIQEINFEIQKLLQNDKTSTSADIKSIERQIEGKMEGINKKTNYQEIEENKKSIDQLISKKINFIGEVTENSQIKELIPKRRELQNKKISKTKYQKSDKSGIVSYKIDGLEDKLTINNLEQINEKMLEDLDLKTGKIIPTNNECGKIIDNFKCYLAVTMDSKDAMESKVGDKVEIRTASNEEYKAKVYKINEEIGKRTILFEIKSMPESFISHRKISVDIIWHGESGLKIPVQSIIEKNGLQYVVRKKAEIETELLIKVELKTDKFAIVRPYTDKELKEELNYDSDKIRNYRKLNNYDEILILQ